MSDRTTLYVSIASGALLLGGALVYTLARKFPFQSQSLSGWKTNRNHPVNLYVYENSIKPRENHHLSQLRQVTLQHPDNRMSTPPEQTQFLNFLTTLIGAKKAIDIGVFTGLSALAVSLALPEDGKLVACDVSEEYVNIGKPFWERAGVLGKIDLKIQPAVETLEGLIRTGEAETYDMAFIDADKENYSTYVNLCYQLLRKGGVVVIDNVLWSGLVADPSVTDSCTVAIRELNRKLSDDPRFLLSMLKIADGVTLLMKI